MTAAKGTAKAVDKDKLLTRRIPEGTVELPGLGVVKVRGLSRGEVYAIRKVAGDATDYDAKVLTRCMLEPAMNEDEARQWINASPAAEIEPVIDKVNDLSGLHDDADKSELPEVRGDA